MSRNASTLRLWIVAIWLVMGTVTACSHNYFIPITESTQPLYLTLTQAAVTLNVALSTPIPGGEETNIPSNGEVIKLENAKLLSSSVVLRRASADAIAFLPESEEMVLLGEGGLATIDISQSESGYATPRNLSLPIVMSHPSLLNVARNRAVVAWVNNDKSVDVWNRTDPENARTLANYEVSITGVALSPDGENITLSTYDNVLRSWKYNLGEKTKEWATPSWLINLSYSPDSKYIGGADPSNFKVYIIDAENGQLLRTLEWQNNASPVLYGAYFSPDWKHIAWISRGSAQIMETESEEFGPLLSHEDFISAVAWSPFSQILAIGSAATVNGNLIPVVVLWDVLSGDRISTLSQSAPVKSLAFSSDGKTLAVLDNNGDLQTWSIKE